MPTEELFTNSTPLAVRNVWQKSRDYAGRDFRRYVTPDTYRPLSDGLSLRDYLNLTAQGQLLTLFEPQTKPRFGYTASELRALQVSPNIKAGIFDKSATALVYYMDDENQYTVAYKLTKLADLEISDLIDPNDLTVGDRVRLAFREFLINLAPTGDIETGSDTLDGIIDFIQERFDYSQFLAVWTATGFVTEPLSVVTGTTGSSAGSNGGTSSTTTSTSTEEGTIPLLPLALIAGGLFTGMPAVALGGGALLLLNRRDQDSSGSSNPFGATIERVPIDDAVRRVVGSTAVRGGAAGGQTIEDAVTRRVIDPSIRSTVTFRGI
jgi:hypothetical protein